MSVICCQKAIDADHGQSPFRQIVCVDWYDGVISALAQCASCGGSYLASMVAWSAKHSVRVFAVSTLPEGAFARIVARSRESDSPAWPVWIPQNLDSVREVTKSIVLQRELPNFLVAARALDQQIIACAAVEDRGMVDRLAALIERSQQVQEGKTAYLVDLEVVASQSPAENASWFSALQIGELLSE
ncbi:MAG: hypothetical protein L0211_09810 [Planctomycetaceae bacterium]|nr:hypothetical protein [Planctomycetaceae bacterium]